MKKSIIMGVMCIAVAAVMFCLFRINAVAAPKKCLSIENGSTKYDMDGDGLTDSIALIPTTADGRIVRVSIIINSSFKTVPIKNGADSSDAVQMLLCDIDASDGEKDIAICVADGIDSKIAFLRYDKGIITTAKLSWMEKTHRVVRKNGTWINGSIAYINGNGFVAIKRSSFDRSMPGNFEWIHKLKLRKTVYSISERARKYYRPDWAAFPMTSAKRIVAYKKPSRTSKKMIIRKGEAVYFTGSDLLHWVSFRTGNGRTGFLYFRRGRQIMPSNLDIWAAFPEMRDAY